ncbi:MAG: carbohydrate kinase [Candidatus Electrothrix sp. EH2]|nr:carbohydrate kinase [Candidatus Electrothrix sp. EH2]
MWLFGEILFDTFPDGTAVLGGAPFNVAWNLNAFQTNPEIITAVGDDPPGREIQERMDSRRMSRNYLTILPEYPTGKVTVSLTDGEPSYTIEENQAYDNIPLNSLPERTQGFLYFGSLALRTRHNREVLAALKKRHQGKIFVDINLRAPFWTVESVVKLLDDVHWLKLNEDELSQLTEENNEEVAALQLKNKYSLEGIVVTCGSRGTFAFGPDNRVIRVKPKQAAEVRDTVGAGDAFASVLLLGLLRSWTLEDTLTRAQDFAAAVVGLQGAVSTAPEFYQQYLQTW